MIGGQIISIGKTSNKIKLLHNNTLSNKVVSEHKYQIR